MERKTVLGVGLAVFGMWLVSAWLMTATISSWEVRGQFGDMFGAVNSLFSGLAFAGIVLAILLQRAELQLQREELRLAREEQQRLVEAQQDASRSLERQFRIQTLAARATLLHVIVTEATAALQRGSDAVVAALHAGQSGVKSEDFAPGASTRLKRAQADVTSTLEDGKWPSSGNGQYRREEDCSWS